MNDKVRQSILETLCWFDVFDMPLTKEELWRWLWKGAAIGEVSFLEQLADCVEQEIVATHGGYYFLPGRQETIGLREARVGDMDQKLKIAKRAAKKMRHIPFLRAVFVCNTVAMGVGGSESDIDVFVVVRKGRLWLARFLTTVWLGLWRLRRTKRRVHNKICLSFYIADNHLDVSDLLLDAPDIYFAYWLDQLIPVYDPEGLRDDLFQKNTWAQRLLPHAFQPYQLIGRNRVDDASWFRCVRRALEAMWGKQYGDLIESQAKALQQTRMKLNRSSVQDADDTRVVVTDEVMKFHENDRRGYYRGVWEERVGEYTS